MHSHTNRSDGDFDLASLEKLYFDKGYLFIAITDHRIYYKQDDGRLNGCEYNCYLDLDKRYHFHLLTLDKGQSTLEHDDNTYKSLFYTNLSQVQALIDELKAKGNMVFIAHPKNIKIPFHMMKALKNYDGIEVYNSKAQSDASDYYEALLLDRDIKCLAVDDSHQYTMDDQLMFFKGYIVIEDDLDPLEALKAGAYYSSTGVQIEAITCENRRLQVKTTADVEVYMYTSDRVCSICQTSQIHLPDQVTAFRLVCYEGDKKAWTNLIQV